MTFLPRRWKFIKIQWFEFNVLLYSHTRMLYDVRENRHFENYLVLVKTTFSKAGDQKQKITALSSFIEVVSICSFAHLYFFEGTYSSFRDLPPTVSMTSLYRFHTTDQNCSIGWISFEEYNRYALCIVVSLLLWSIPFLLLETG